MKPDLKISAAVFGRYPQCVDSVGQDWATWLDRGYVDFVCPMNYTTERAEFASLTRNQLVRAGGRGKIYPGLGVSSSKSQLSADQVIAQVNTLRVLGADGFVLFGLSRSMRDETLPMLSLGITRPTGR